MKIRSIQEAFSLPSLKAGHCLDAVSVYGLDTGETEGLTLALEIGAPNAFVIMDELPGRRAAVQLGINHTGTLGLLLNAKALGILPAVKPELDRLDELGFRVSKQTREL